MAEQVSFRPTRSAVVLAAVGLVLYGAGLQSQVGWLFVVAALVVGALVSSAFIAAVGLAGITATVETKSGQSRVHEGDAITIRVTLRNRARWPRFLVEVGVPCPALASVEAPRWLIADLPPGRPLAVEAAVLLPRGEHRLGPVVLATSAPFGLFRRVRSVPAETRGLIFPNYWEIARPVGRTDRSAPMVRAPRIGQAEELYGTREYRSGDPVRDLHWRSSARRGSLVVREREAQGHAPVSIVLPVTPVRGEGRESSAEWSIRVAATMARVATAGGRAVRLCTYSLPASTLAWDQTLVHLARLRTGVGPDLPALCRRARSEGTVVAILARPRAEDVDALAGLARRSRVLAVLLTGYGATDEEIDTAALALRAAGVTAGLLSPGPDLPGQLAALAGGWGK